MKKLLFIFGLMFIFVSFCGAQDFVFFVNKKTVIGEHSFTTGFYDGYYKSILDYGQPKNGIGIGFNLSTDRLLFLFDMGFLNGSYNGSDTDYILSVLFAKGLFKTRSSLNYGFVSIGYRIKQTDIYNVDLLGCYFQSEVVHRMNDGNYTILNYKWTEYGKLIDLNSFYSEINNAFGTGLQITLLNTTSLAVKYFPSVRTKGEGWWNLRNMNFYQYPQFRMLDSVFKYTYKIFKNVNINMSYNIRYYKYDKQWKPCQRVIDGERIEKYEKITKLIDDVRFFQSFNIGLTINIYSR